MVTTIPEFPSVVRMGSSLSLLLNVFQQLPAIAARSLATHRRGTHTVYTYDNVRIFLIYKKKKNEFYKTYFN